MTAPGQEPDEVMTAKPGGEKEAADEQREANDDAAGDARMAPQTAESSSGDQTGRAAESYDPKTIGDTHLPEDLRDDENARRERLSGE